MVLRIADHICVPQWISVAIQDRNNIGSHCGLGRAHTPCIYDCSLRMGRQQSLQLCTRVLFPKMFGRGVKKCVFFKRRASNCSVGSTREHSVGNFFPSIKLRPLAHNFLFDERWSSRTIFSLQSDVGALTTFPKGDSTEYLKWKKMTSFSDLGSNGERCCLKQY